MRGCLRTAVTETIPPIAPPEPIHTCPQCSHWLSEGTLACPDCNTIVYSAYLRQLATRASQQEQEKKWAEARETWASMLAWIPAGTTQAQGIQGRVAAIDSRTRADEERKAVWTKRLGPLAPVVFFLIKAKTFLFAILEVQVPA